MSDPVMRSGNFTIKGIRVAVVALLLICAGCGNYSKDVTADPAYPGFELVKGVWKAEVPLFVIQFGDKLALRIDEAQVGGQGEMLESLPSGTEVQIEKLILKSTTDIEMFIVMGSVSSGRYRGREMVMDERMFIEFPWPREVSGEHPQKGWSVDPHKLSSR